jgi:tRNA G10  N-methylase Trm11
VNLVTPHNPDGSFLDPFAGAGSIVQHAGKSGLTVFSADVDESLAAGLAWLGSDHRVSNARSLPFDSNSFDAIATEPPFDRRLGRTAVASITELHRVLAHGGKLAILCARWQVRELLSTANELDLTNLLSCPLDRKGLKCSILSWQKN